jgi:hypothetical protein
MQNRYEPVHDWLVFNAHRLDAATLKSLDGTVDEDGSSDDSLQKAVTALDAEQARQFGAFSRYFVAAVQDPDEEGEVIDEQELGRFQRALTLTRVTAVNDEATPVLQNDPDFRWRNRELMKRIKDELATELGGTPVPTVSQPHSESGAYLYQPVDKGAWYTLTLYHGEATAAIWVEAAARRLTARKQELQDALTPTMPTFDDSDAGKIWLWRHQFDSSTDIKNREDFLRGHALPVLREAQRAISGRLE